MFLFIYGKIVLTEVYMLSAEQVLQRSTIKRRGLESALVSDPESPETCALMVCEGRPIGLQGYSIGLRTSNVTPDKSISEWIDYVKSPPVTVRAGADFAQSSPHPMVKLFSFFS